MLTAPIRRVVASGIGALVTKVGDSFRHDTDNDHSGKRKGLTKKEIDAHSAVLETFVDVYCRDHHGDEWSPDSLCDECQDLLRYSRRKLERCPYNPKPKCKECTTHCYKHDSRDRIRKVMRYSGTFFVKRGRIDWLVKYFLLEGVPNPFGKKKAA